MGKGKQSAAGIRPQLFSVWCYAMVLTLHILLSLSPVSCRRLLEPPSCAIITGTQSGNKPKCKFEISEKSEAGSTVTCPDGRIRITGEYDSVYITCSAKAPLNFKFDGTKPTEALRVNYGRELKAGTTREIEAYTVTVEVLSIKSLHRRSGISSSSREQVEERFRYSRTGSYTFEGFNNNRISTTSFYIFFEDPLDTPGFILNRGTVQPFYEDGFECARIPCRPTHHGLNVTVLSTGTSTDSFDSENGARVCGTLSESSQFTCRFIYNGRSIERVVPDGSNEDNYGLEGVELSVGGEITYSSARVGFGSVNTTISCTLEDVNGKIGLATIGTPNTASYDLLRDFVLPKFQGRSYSIMRGSVEGKSIRIGPTPSLVGVSFCANNEERQLKGFGVSGMGSAETFNVADSGWRKQDVIPGDYMSIQHDGESHPRLYEYQNLTVSCFAHEYIFAKPIVLLSERMNGTRIRESLSYDLDGGVARLELVLATDMTRIFCSASVIQSGDERSWKEVSVDVKVFPSLWFDPSGDEKKTVLSNNSLAVLACNAESVSDMDVSWASATEREGLTWEAFPALSNGQRMTSVLVMQGKFDVDMNFTCTLRNKHTTLRKSFHVRIQKVDNGVATTTRPTRPPSTCAPPVKCPDCSHSTCAPPVECPDCSHSTCPPCPPTTESTSESNSTESHPESFRDCFPWWAVLVPAFILAPLVALAWRYRQHLTRDSFQRSAYQLVAAVQNRECPRNGPCCGCLGSYPGSSTESGDKHGSSESRDDANQPYDLPTQGRTEGRPVNKPSGLAMDSGVELEATDLSNGPSGGTHYDPSGEYSGVSPEFTGEENESGKRRFKARNFMSKLKSAGRRTESEPQSSVDRSRYVDVGSIPLDKLNADGTAV